MMRERRRQKQKHLYFSIHFKSEENAAQKGERSICLQTENDIKSEKRKKGGGKVQDKE